MWTEWACWRPTLQKHSVLGLDMGSVLLLLGTLLLEESAPSPGSEQLGCFLPPLFPVGDSGADLSQPTLWPVSFGVQLSIMLT